MKLRFRVLSCAFRVPVNPGRIPRRQSVVARAPVASEYCTDGSSPRVTGCHRTAVPPVPLSSNRAFTLIELLTVIAIVGILAALVAPVFIHFTKPDVTEAATRQMLDDVARARQLAITQRATVYMVFIPTNFWGKT